MTRFVSKLAVSLMVLAGLAGVTRAQETTTEHDVIRPITASGSAAFLFTIKGLGTFGIGSPSIDGATSGIGAKWYVANDIALRVLLGLSSAQNVDSLVDPTKTLSTTTFGIGVGGEWHFRPLWSTSPYVGLQIGFTSTSQDIDVGEAGASKIETDKSTTFGVTPFAGFDWFFTHGMAVGAEMGLAFVSRGGTLPNGTSKTSTSNIRLMTNGSVHFDVYF
ncbi:MAG TPA: hypothetical protein VG537_11590 [Candidatus Kapabacteria bacterium]|jgi:hypothetical protein|nr:hypothetical protein [Candidatus Kapabacteria bacterium]